MSLVAQKRELRRFMDARREAAWRENPDAPLALRDQFLNAIELLPGQVVAGYSARGHEMDPAPLLAALQAKGHVIALPAMIDIKAPLAFRMCRPGDSLIENAFGIKEPALAAPLTVPDVILVPLTAFDRTLARLGRGGGYYDRTLEDLRRQKTVLAIGIAFACQEYPAVPQEPHDGVLNKIVTEKRVF
ncbi:MAG: 5-formyltetrahydrofolate cyclo-ligase [Pseudomonadota bacterium]|nr:5-formyltetrahydrofolate cyclo-ligase [Pseudomonadota bacterium]